MLTSVGKDYHDNDYRYFGKNAWMILQVLIDSGVIGDVIHIQHLEPVRFILKHITIQVNTM